jgi:hypothetical protein
MPKAVLWQRIEGLVIFIAGLALVGHDNTALSASVALALFFAPDLSFLAYLLGPKPGAFAYNAVHIYAFGTALLTIGLIVPLPLLTQLGALWLAHSGFDRMLGYGLKSPEDFSITHLGRIGKRT